MTLITQIENIKKKISGKITFNENLSKLSWFGLFIIILSGVYISFREQKR